MPTQDIRKFTLCSRCPALTQLLQLITPSMASGTADHLRSLDDLFFHVEFFVVWKSRWLPLDLHLRVARGFTPFSAVSLHWWLKICCIDLFPFYPSPTLSLFPSFSLFLAIFLLLFLRLPMSLLRSVRLKSRRWHIQLPNRVSCLNSTFPFGLFLS